MGAQAQEVRVGRNHMAENFPVEREGVRGTDPQSAWRAGGDVVTLEPSREGHLKGIPARTTADHDGVEE